MNSRQQPVHVKNICVRKISMMQDPELLHLYLESKIVQLVEAVESADLDIPSEIPIDSVRRRVDLLRKLRETCASGDGWILQKESHGVRTYYQNHPETTNIHSIRLDGDVEAPMFIVLALFHEVDLFSKWIPTYSFLGLNFARLVKHPSPTELLVHLNINIPWPFANRYCFFHCDGIDCMDAMEPQIGVMLNNLTSETDNGVQDEAVKTTFHEPSGILLTPLPSGATRVQVVVNVDPQISLVPDWLIDFAVRNLAYLIILQIRKAVEIVKADPEYHKRMTDADNEFYNHIKKRISESLPSEKEFIPV